MVIKYQIYREGVIVEIPQKSKKYLLSRKRIATSSSYLPSPKIKSVLNFLAITVVVLALISQVSCIHTKEKVTDKKDARNANQSSIDAALYLAKAHDRAGRLAEEIALLKSLLPSREYAPESPAMDKFRQKSEAPKNYPIEISKTIVGLALSHWIFLMPF